MSADKLEYLVCYDYGMGGLWGVFSARTADEITMMYPELTVVAERPKWMTEEDYRGLRGRELHDIDGPPGGILNAVIADRNSE
jgi:hypothetical protein